MQYQTHRDALIMASSNNAAHVSGPLGGMGRGGVSQGHCLARDLTSL